MVRYFAFSAMLVALAPFQWSAKPLPQTMKSQLEQRGFWKKGCPVGLGDLRLLTVSHLGYDGETHQGSSSSTSARPARCRARSARLYRNRFPIRHMRFEDFYGPKRQRPERRDGVLRVPPGRPVAVHRRQRTGTWSNHAYGLAIDINPRENPYVGCGQSNDPTAQSYRDRSRSAPG